MIKSGKKELKISNPAADFVIAKKDKIMELCWKRCYVYCIVFLLTAGITNVIYFAVTKEAEVMYVDEAVYQKTAARSRKDAATWKEPIYLSQREVDEIRDDGGIVRRYREGEPMYLMDNYDTIPKMEYFRYAISTGVLAGILLIIVLLAIELKRGVVLNENINGE